MVHVVDIVAAGLSGEGGKSALYEAIACQLRSRPSDRSQANV